MAETELQKVTDAHGKEMTRWGGEGKGDHVGLMALHCWPALRKRCGSWRNRACPDPPYAAPVPPGEDVRGHRPGRACRPRGDCLW